MSAKVKRECMVDVYRLTRSVYANDMSRIRACMPAVAAFLIVELTHADL